METLETTTYCETDLIAAEALAGLCSDLERVAETVLDEIATTRAVLAVVLGEEPTGSIPMPGKKL